MLEVSEYWYEKKDIPYDEKIRIKKLVKGNVVGAIVVGGTKHQLLKTDGNVFMRVFGENRKFLYKGDYTAPPNENDYLDSVNYLTEDGLAGFSITDNGWLVSVYSNYLYGGFVKAVKPYVLKDSYKLVCIVADTDEGNKLVDLYQHVYGFRKYAMTINDTEIMRHYYGDDFINAFVSKNGKPFHVFMIGNNAVGDEGGIRRFDDYFEAEAFVDSSVRKIK